MTAPILRKAGAQTLADIDAAARRFENEAFAPNTRRAYARAWAAFVRWCDERGLLSLPASAETIRLHLTDLASEKGLSTVATRKAALQCAHLAAGHRLDDELLAKLHFVLRGIRRTKAIRAKRQAPPLDAPAFAKLVAKIELDITGLRDRALIALGFDFFLRRSEISALDMEAIAIGAEGMEIDLRRSKSDQDGKGLRLWRPRREDERACPVAWFEDWVLAAKDLPAIRVKGVWCRPAFRAVDRFGHVLDTRLSGESIRRIVRDRARAGGLDRVLDFSAHSLRAGGLTAALDGGLDIGTVSAQARHTRIDTTRIYDRRGRRAQGNKTADATARAFYPETAGPIGPAARFDPLKPSDKVGRANEALAQTVRETADVIARTGRAPAAPGKTDPAAPEAKSRHEAGQGETRPDSEDPGSGGNGA